ncbi:YvrJ family protein [Salicibibacter halophilus]|uniref:YvrJ family protein n=1 Tax=Salicibibacter halophilus TaxID=2502791 RepID=A0A514LHN5_9BACI|nr:YvrJ family protein [Salicibibacter halophilus]QDI91357.1 YvrJ family protein [Salicibibacter halophilus]
MILEFLGQFGLPFLFAAYLVYRFERRIERLENILHKEAGKERRKR